MLSYFEAAWDERPEWREWVWVFFLVVFLRIMNTVERDLIPALGKSMMTAVDLLVR